MLDLKNEITASDDSSAAGIAQRRKEWDDLIDQIPEERVDFDENGHYDPKKSPEFYDWMVNG